VGETSEGRDEGEGKRRGSLAGARERAILIASGLLKRPAGQGGLRLSRLIWGREGQCALQ